MTSFILEIASSTGKHEDDIISILILIKIGSDTIITDNDIHDELVVEGIRNFKFGVRLSSSLFEKQPSK